MAYYRVTATALNIRSTPRVMPSTRIATLPQGHIVEQLEAPTGSAWWMVSTDIEGTTFTGFVHSAYLIAMDSFPEPEKAEAIVPVHLTRDSLVGRSQGHSRAFALNEDGQPYRNANTARDKTTELGHIVDWLAVDSSQRYLRQSGKTFCNIYTYDYCYLANVFLPRVWWTSSAIVLLSGGTPVSPLPGRTVEEQNANAIHSWLSQYGSTFGWRRIPDLHALQESANNGNVCIMSARHRDGNSSGHICAVVPETDRYQARRRDGVVTVPLQSSAGASNYRYGGHIWWTSSKYSSFSFWRHT